MARLVLGGIAAVLVALLAGFLWGAAARSTAETALEQSSLRSDLLEARGALLAARLDVYNTNFGESSRNLEAGRAVLERAVQRLRTIGRDADAKQLEAAIAAIREAQQLAGKLDLAANNRAADATRMIESVLQATSTP